MAEPLRIDADEAKRRLDTGQAILLDVVAPMAWEQLDRAARGAVRIAPDQIGERWRELPSDRVIIAYCT